MSGKIDDVIYGYYQWQSKSHGHACRLEKMFPGKYGHSERSTGADFRDLFEVPFGFENLWHQTHLQLWLVQLYFNIKFMFSKKATKILKIFTVD